MQRKLYPSLTLLLLILAPGPVLAELAGRVISFTGDSDVLRTSDGSREPIRQQLPIQVNDQIETSIDGQVKLLLTDESVLMIGPDSEMTISEAYVNSGESQTSVSLAKGWLRSMVGKQLGQNSHFRIKTPVAVAGVRGTDNTVYHDSTEGTTGVRGQDGTTEVTNANPEIGTSVDIVKDTYTLVQEGEPPTPPAYIAPTQTLRQIIRERKTQTDSGSEAEEEVATDQTNEGEEEESAIEKESGGEEQRTPTESGAVETPAPVVESFAIQSSLEEREIVITELLEETMDANAFASEGEASALLIELMEEKIQNKQELAEDRGASQQFEDAAEEKEQIAPITLEEELQATVQQEVSREFVVTEPVVTDSELQQREEPAPSEPTPAEPVVVPTEPEPEQPVVTPTEPEPEQPIVTPTEPEPEPEQPVLIEPEPEAAPVFDPTPTTPPTTNPGSVNLPIGVTIPGL
ncbi:MAG: FecR domain-containing protein [Gammaproteobacteria bacterium]|nr:FecR domain-containing protein [Gammaproteobacteria bacterium]